jgi:hypothetical protein
MNMARKRALLVEQSVGPVSSMPDLSNLANCTKEAWNAIKDKDRGPDDPTKFRADQSVINLHSRCMFNGKLRVSGPAVCWRYDSECSKRGLSEPIDTSEYNHD